MTPIYPLELNGKYDEARFFLYDGVGKRIWGELRVRRSSSQPDVMELDVARRDGSRLEPFKPLMMLTAIQDQLAVRTMNLSEQPKGIITP